MANQESSSVESGQAQSNDEKSKSLHKQVGRLLVTALRTAFTVPIPESPHDALSFDEQVEKIALELRWVSSSDSDAQDLDREMIGAFKNHARMLAHGHHASMRVILGYEHHRSEAIEFEKVFRAQK